MKRILILLILFFSFICVPNLVYAETTSPTPTPKVDYQLPYPGILPDSPLYFLKAFRDRVIIFLISDPLKKADFDLVSADKHLNAGVYLIAESGKQQLAASTISKGENYFEEGIKNLREAKKQGEDISDLLRRMSQSSLKHEEVLADLEPRATKDIKPQILQLKKKMMEYGKQVDSLIVK